MQGRADGPEVSRGWKARQRDRGLAADVADTRGSVRGGLGRGVRAVGDESWVAGQDRLRMAATEVSGAVRGRAGADASATTSSMAGDGWAGQGGVLRADPSSRSIGRVRLHAHGKSERDARRPALRSHGLPFRIDLLELGDGFDLFFGELRESQRGAATRALGARRGAPATPL